jgi:DNA-binding XRE family transcriptional regulator
MLEREDLQSEIEAKRKICELFVNEASKIYACPV